MSPTRCPRSTVWPSLQRKTMRRASSPAICLKVTSNPSSAPWPRTVTVFCSLRSAEAGFMAFRILALLVVHTAQDAADGRAVHMDIENAEEDADALPRTFGCRNGGGLGDQAVARRNNQAVAGRNCALRIAEEPEEKRGQQDRHDAPDPLACNPLSAAATASKLNP